jgi:hypothetical protein
MELNWRVVWSLAALFVASFFSVHFDLGWVTPGEVAPTGSVAAGVGLTGLMLEGMWLWLAVPLGAFLAFGVVQIMRG